MKFDPWTFVFQIINFGVLLLILKRVLYRPLREIMEKRRALAVRTQEEAEEARRTAQELQVTNQAEMQRLQTQQAAMMEKMREEVVQQRQKLLAEANLEVQRHIDRERSLFATEKARRTKEVEEQAMATVALFATSLLKDIADADLHRALCRRLAAEMEKISPELGGATGVDGVLMVDVASAYPLSEGEQHSLQEGLENATGCRVTLRTTTARELLAGAKIMAGDWCYDGSLSGQLTAFTTKMRKNA
jgi:F-type H+-transporting ATPase subunit b